MLSVTLISNTALQYVHFTEIVRGPNLGIKNIRAREGYKFLGDLSIMP